MRELPENIYVLNKPGDDITVIHMNNEINIFGKYTSIKTTQFVTYPPINDEPKTIANEDAYWRNAIIGTLVTVALGAAAIAVVATATVVTGGVALAAIALAGAAVGTGLVTAGAAKADRESGNARDTSDFLMQLVTGGAIGAFVGATFYSIVPVLPQASSLMSAGICAEFGISSGAFGTALGYGITGVGAMALTGNTMLSYDQVYAMGSGESFLLDTLFDGDQNAYDTATVVCDSLTMGYMDMCMQYYAANAGAAATADDVEDGTGQGTTGSAKLNTSAADADGADVSPSGTGTKASSTSSTASASIADDGVEQPKTTNSKVAGEAGDNADTTETVKPKTTNTTDDGAEASGTGASGKKSGLYMEEGERRNTISQADRNKIDGWDYTPDDELYLKYKDVYDNPKYYDQKTGAINWPENDGFVSTPIDEVLQQGTRIDRYGSDFGSFVSPEGTPYEMRAVAPGTDLRPYSVFEVVEPINVKAGGIAPWFNEPGGGIQYLLPDTVDELLDAGILRRIK